MNDYEQSCEYFEILISSAIDGEASEDERVELADHLDHCHGCRQRKLNFEMVNTRLAEVVMPDDFSVVASAATYFPGKKKQIVSRSRKFRLTVLASAAAVAILMMNLTFENEPGSRTDVVTPLVQLAEINSQRLRDQELMRESLEYELRTLKLQTESLDENNAREILDRIDRLMEKIEGAKILDS